MEKPDASPIDWPSRLRMRTHAEWNVDTHMRWATGPIRPSRRSRISAAALLVKVMARIWLGHAPNCVRIHAMRRVSTRVLPDPAPAPISSAGPRYCTASACCGLRSPTRSSALLAMRSGSCCTLFPLTVDDDSAFLFTTWFGQCHSIWATSHSANAFLRPEAYRSSPCPACGWMPSGPSQSVCAAIALFQSTRIESVGCLRT